MPRNDTIHVGQTPIQLTVGAAERVTVYNEGPAAITLAASADDGAPGTMVGPTIQPGFALPSSISIAELFPGVEGATRLWAVAGVGGADVFVSHA